MKVSDFLVKFNKKIVYCSSFYIQFFSYLKNEYDVEYNCKFIKDLRTTDKGELYKLRECKIRNFSIKSCFTCYPQGIKEEIFISISLYFNPKVYSDFIYESVEDKVLELGEEINL